MKHALICFTLFATSLSGQSVRQDESAQAGGGWQVRRPASAEQSLDSTLAALKEGAPSQNHLAQQLAHVMMGLAESNHRPTWPVVASFTDKLTKQLIGKQLNGAQMTALRQCLTEAMRRTSTSNAGLASRLQETLAGIGIEPPKTQPVVRDFIALREAIQGPDDSPLQHLRYPLLPPRR
jgi:hypothetical protein